MEIAIIVICLLLSAFFSGMEIAYVSSNKVYLSIEKKQHNFNARILSKLTEKPSQFITSMLVGNNVVLVVYGIYSGDLLMNWITSFSYTFSPFINLLLQTLLSTAIILMTAEFLPKVFFQIYANSFVKLFAAPAYIFYQLFFWVSKFIIWISDFILKKFFKTDGDQVQDYFSKVELGNYISEQMSSISEDHEIDSEIQIFQNALEFSDLKARDIMTPRTEISGVDILDSVSELKELFINTGYSKIIVYQNSIDDILGYVHSFELFKKPKTIKSVMMPIEYVPETIFVKDLLDILTKKRKSMAVILDEYGGTSGIVTVEDIIEELFGEIEDEHDLDEELIDEKIEENVFLFSGRLDVEFINQKYNLSIPENDSYSTLGGYIVHNTKEIPQNEEKIKIENFEITIHSASNKKIELVRLSILEEKQ
ncbi:hemolysin [Flavobacterium sp. 316]|uniref:Hemolysin family protein n=1 Tax=Flavobacterium sediminilitoris TaxID=2024526 RepID=A0ABY4HR34_9FLAO|nr:MULTISPECIES: hemolysin family protein [Flavobacterium]KIX20992.1 hemolysin [Flavobacterium sp. 316]UOX35339.1 hemolysin family protein [Flavobacterium sediminilitoris]